MQARRWTVLLALTLCSLPAIVLAETSCAPRDNSALILASPSADDIHPAWRGENSVGLSWSFVPYGDEADSDYLNGDLYSPKGAVVNSDVYILKDEWDCE